MDCPNCKTYNPEDRTVCWRCDQPLPKPVAKKKRQMSSQQWMYIIVAVMVLLMVLNMCGIRPFQSQQPADTGAIGAPHVAQVLPQR